MIASPLAQIDPAHHLLIAGPTASGKSALALGIAKAQGGVIVNADALQIWSCWRVLTARPSPAETAAAAHLLYGHVAPGHSYSVGSWLAEIETLLRQPQQRLIIVGGTGLYFQALTKGLAYVPPIPPEIRQRGDKMLSGKAGLAQMLSELDPATRAKIDIRNPARVQRAWEVFVATGRGLSAWQADTPPPILPAENCQKLLISADRDWLAERIAQRFRGMVSDGALAEAKAMMPLWDPVQQWARAIGAPELMAHLRGETTLDEAIQLAIFATRQYAKSQRIWFRARMKDWLHIPAEAISHCG